MTTTAKMIQLAQEQWLLPELNKNQNETLHRLWQQSKNAALERIKCAKQLRTLEEQENAAINELRRFLGQQLNLTRQTQ